MGRGHLEEDECGSKKRVHAGGPYIRRNPVARGPRPERRPARFSLSAEGVGAKRRGGTRPAGSPIHFRQLRPEPVRSRRISSRLRPHVAAEVLPVEADLLGRADRAARAPRRGRAHGPRRPRTRPPAVTSFPSADLAVPAWKTKTPSSAVASSIPSIALPRSNGPGYPSAARTTAAPASFFQTGLAFSSNFPRADAEEVREEVVLHPDQDALRLGVAEPHVVLEDVRASSRSRASVRRRGRPGTAAPPPPCRGASGGRCRSGSRARSPRRRRPRGCVPPSRPCSGRGRRRRPACSPSRSRAGWPARRRRGP